MPVDVGNMMAVIDDALKEEAERPP